MGRPFEAAFPPPAARVGQREEVLTVEGLQGQSFGPMSFTLVRGEIWGSPEPKATANLSYSTVFRGEFRRRRRVVVDETELYSDLHT